ncbi:MAG: hypothetical protein VKP63_04605 [Cyanobacteriota bacterium]|nr:hypothetical protein [Cyanobacteriota bacterium]
MALPAGSNASIIFSDDFSQIPASRGMFTTLPPSWSIGNNGWVEILGECDFHRSTDLLPGNNCYIDLDGNLPEDLEADPPNLFQTGLLQASFFLQRGFTYEASFELAGNQIVPFGDTVDVNFGAIQKPIFVAPYSDFTLYSILFEPITSGEYTLSFLNSNVDAFGALLDDVVVTQTPAPLPVLGFGAVLAYSRRLRRKMIQRMT